jgi:hypothetical protein
VAARDFARDADGFGEPSKVGDSGFGPLSCVHDSPRSPQGETYAGMSDRNPASTRARPVNDP